MVQFPFGAAFTSLLTIPLRAEVEEDFRVSDVLATVSGRVWVVDASAAELKIFSQDGHRLGSLRRTATGLRRPVSLTPLHSRWIAVLDGHLPAVVILDELGRLVRRFLLPELDRPFQVCNLDDRRLAVVGSGWGPGAGKLLHLYTTGGDYLESLFGEPRGARAPDRAFIAAAGSAVYLAHSRADSFAVYDVEARAVLSFPVLNASVAERRQRCGVDTHRLEGLFVAPCGPLIAQYSVPDRSHEYGYDLYKLDGSAIALGLRSPERVVGVEGPLFYSVRPGADGAVELRVWKLLAEVNGGVVSGAR
jgi:hypothetical protein